MSARSGLAFVVSASALLEGRSELRTTNHFQTSFDHRKVQFRPLYWDDAYDIARALQAAHPDVDPLSLKFTTLHQWITALPDFADDPARATEGRLEAIQMAWYEETQV